MSLYAQLLKHLQIHEYNFGASIGSNWFYDANQVDTNNFVAANLLSVDHLDTINENILQSFCPINDVLLAKVYKPTIADLNLIITKSVIAQKQLASFPAPKRGEIVRLIGNELRKHKSDLGMLVSLEMGKSLVEGEAEVQEMIDMADFAVGQSRMLYGNTMHSERPKHRMYEQWHPLGVVAVFSAFNFPVAVWAWNAFLSIICGNTVIWKPSPKTPLCAIAVHKICAKILQEYDYPEILSLFITDNLDLSRKLIDNRLVNLVSFTGSTKAGKEVAERLSARFAKSILELGGNNAVILDKSANLANAIPSIVFSAIGTAGQRCTTLRRLIIHESIYSQTIQALVAAYEQIKVGDPTNTDVHMGPLIDKEAVKMYQNALNLVLNKKAKILFGGNVLNSLGCFVEPTIVEASANLEIVNQETFAPILYVMSYTNLSEAIAINNQVDYGLSSAIFTSDLQVAEEFLSHVGSDCGIANVNIGTSGAEIGGAFGGEKHTGGGREAGSDAWRSYMRRQTSTINYGNELVLAQGIKFNI